MTFRAYLRHIEADLDVPYPERRDLLLELEAHLWALRDELVEQGATTADADARAIEALAIDREFVRRIDEVHHSLASRLVARLPRRLAGTVELAAILVTGLCMLGPLFWTEAGMIGFLREGGLFMIPINVAGLAIVLVALERAYSLFVKRDHSDANLGRRLTLLAFLGIATSLLGVLGTLVGLFEATAAGAQQGEIPVFRVVQIALSTSIWGMTLSLVALVAYFVVRAKAEGIRRMRLVRPG